MMMSCHKYVTFAVIALAILCSGLITSTPAYADGYYNGYVSGDYTYRDGYWWKDGKSYERYRVEQVYTYYQHGYQYTGKRYVWQYKEKSPEKVVISLNDERWREQLLEIAKQRDLYEGRLRSSALEHSEFVESVRVLGLEGNFRWNGYGYEMSYANDPHAAVQQQAYTQFPQAQGATVYGYTELADVYGNVDIGALYNQVLRLREQSYSYENQATSETHALVGDLTERMAQIKEIEAKGRAAAAALEASRAADRATLLRQFWATGSAPPAAGGGAAAATNTRPDVNDPVAAMQQIIAQKCLKCHAGAGSSGGLDLSDVYQLDARALKSTLERIISPNPALRMPLADDRGPGEPLTAAETAIFFTAINGTQNQQPTTGQ
jgi:mono/diheme cytochrome c family protein